MSSRTPREPREAEAPDSSRPLHPRLRTGDYLITGHRDYVTDLCYNYFGRRLACCSSDHSVKVYDREGARWVAHPGCHWKAANGAIYRVTWAHPEFGQVLAICSEDKTVTVWEEQSSVLAANVDLRSRWHSIAELSESKKAVRDLEFAPIHLGLWLAAAAADGQVRVYEVLKPGNLGHWPLRNAFDTDIAEMGPLCLSWNKSSFEPPMLVVGGHDGAVQVWVEESRRWVCAWGPQLVTEVPEVEKAAEADEAEASLARGDGAVVDIDWAPNIGRSFHLIAATSVGGGPVVIKLRRSPLELISIRRLRPQASDITYSVWRLQWNATGTLLSASCDDGRVRLFKADFSGENWLEVGVVDI